MYFIFLSFLIETTDSLHAQMLQLQTRAGLAV